jgi:hypothetical protein
MELEGKRMRMEQASREEDLMIFDGEAQRMYVVDAAKKTYHLLDEATAKAMGAKISAQMAAIPPEVRERMKAAGMDPGTPKATPKHTWSIEKAGGSATVARHACQYYRLLKDGKPAGHGEEVCLIAWGGDVRREDFVAWPEFGKFLEKTLGAMMSGIGGDRGMGNMGEQMFGAWFSTAPGFPGQSVKVDASGKRTVDWEITSIERRAIPAGRFAPPAGYKQVAMDEEMPGPKHGK